MSSGPRLGQLPLLLPSVAVAWLFYFLYFEAAPRGVLAARIYAGPTSNQTAPLHLRVVAFESFEGTTRPASRRNLLLHSPSASSPLRSMTDTAGCAELTLPRSSTKPGSPHSNVIRITSDSDSGTVELAQGTLRNAPNAWQDIEPRFNSIRGTSSGSFAVTLKARPPVFAVPYRGSVEISLALSPEASGASTPPPANLGLNLTLVGGTFTNQSSSLRVFLDPRGHGRVDIFPEGHAIELTVESENEPLVKFYGALPVVPGAMTAELNGKRLTVRSPILRDRAYVHFVTRRVRLGGSVISMVPSSSGQSMGSKELPSAALARLDRENVWAVVSSELAGLSGGAVGWPLPSTHSVAQTTFTPPEVLLLDGLPEALEQETARRTHARRVGAAGALALLVVLGFILGRSIGGRPTSPNF